MTTDEFRKFIEAIEDKRRELSKDEKSTAAYWNGDSWGSASGINDADDWVNRQLAELATKLLKKPSKRRVK